MGERALRYEQFYKASCDAEIRPRRLLMSSLCPHEFLPGGLEPMLEALPDSPLVSVQPSFRLADRSRVHEGDHATLFTMGTATHFTKTREPVLLPMIELAATWVGERRLSLTIHPSDEEAARCWTKVGLHASRVFRRPGNWWSLSLRRERPRARWRKASASHGESAQLCGPEVELFAERSPRRPCPSGTCEPGCLCGRFLELGTAVFPDLLMRSHGVCDDVCAPWEAAMGLDRLAMLVESAPTIFHIASLDAFRRAAEAAVDPLALGQNASLVLADHVRAFWCALADWRVAEPAARPGSRNHGRILRILLRECAQTIRRVGACPREAVAQATSALFSHAEASAPFDLSTIRDGADKILKREFEHWARTGVL